MQIMKNIKKYIIASLTLSFFAISCEIDETTLYDAERATVNFNTTLTQYSFLKTQASTDTVDIPIFINGLASDSDRSADFEVIADSTTALSSEYEIASAIIKAGEFEGNLRVKVTRPDGEDFDDRRIYFRVADGTDFKKGIEIYKDSELILTNELTPPELWTPTGWKSRYFLGNYSTAYYKFIIQATGETEFPYPWAVAGYNNGEKWNSAQKNAFLAKLKAELKEYNESIAPDVLLHDDGLAEGLPVVVGKYYTN